MEVAGEIIEIPGVPAVVVPERVGQAGCIIEYESSANCLPILDGGDSVPMMSAENISVEYLTLENVSIEHETLPYYTLESTDHTQRTGEDE